MPVGLIGPGQALLVSSGTSVCRGRLLVRVASALRRMASPQFDDLGVGTFMVVRQDDGVHDLARDGLGSELDGAHGAAADEGVETSDAAVGAIVEVAPVPTGQALLLVPVQGQ